MTALKKVKQLAIGAMIAAGLGMAGATAPAFAQSSEIRFIVNNVPVTSYEIQRRAAFLRLQQRGGNLQQLAADEMVEQALRMAEAQRLSINVSDGQVDDAYQRFARSNNLSNQQLDQVLAQSGVTRAHFRDYIRAQMAWGQALQARARSQTNSSESNIVAQMFQDGQRPSATEYLLQQVIFVVPASERGARLATRKREAEAMRQRFTSCETTREFARGLVDVTVRDLGRVLEPELPGDWESAIKAARPGAATIVRETERGAEFIGVCSTREVSDDRVAELLFQTQQGSNNASEDELSRTYTSELREKAQIITR
jgi:peptidyl-prolyl cis-trans isomerase SurA